MPTSNPRKPRTNVVKEFESRVARAVEQTLNAHGDDDEWTLEQIMRDIARQLACTRRELRYYEQMILDIAAELGYS